MAQFRLGILPIEVEIGRYRSIPLENRICKLCNLNQIVDEKHVLFFCTLYDDIRKTWIEALKLCMPDFDNISTDNKLKNIFINPRITAKFIVKVMLKRKSILFNMQLLT